MIDLEITIAGLGGTIHRVVATVQQALIDAGAKVIVTDAHPEPTSASTKLHEFNVHIITRHRPWGG